MPCDWRCASVVTVNLSRLGLDQPEVDHNHQELTQQASHLVTNTSSCAASPGWACARSWARSWWRAPLCTPGTWSSCSLVWSDSRSWCCASPRTRTCWSSSHLSPSLVHDTTPPDHQCSWSQEQWTWQSWEPVYILATWQVHKLHYPPTLACLDQKYF